MMTEQDAKRYEAKARTTKDASWWRIAAEAWRQAENEAEAERCECEADKLDP